MRSVIRVLTLGILMLVLPAFAIAGEMDRKPLDQLWEVHMFAGTHGYYINGERSPFTPTNPAGSTQGRVTAADLTTGGIHVSDFRGTELLGLYRGGGWELAGGFLAHVPRSDDTIEIYAKRVWHFYPGLFGIDHYAKLRDEETYEFFLLKREAKDQQATLLKKWVVGPSEIRWFVPPNITRLPGQTEEQLRRQSETTDVRGYLTYDAGSREASVTITGLTHPFVERVKIEK